MKIYTQQQVRVATILGSPIAGSILMAHNEKLVGHKDKRLILYAVSVAALAVMFVIGYVFRNMTSSSGNILFPLLAGWGYSSWYQKTQGDFLTAKFPEAVKASWWSALGVALLVVVAIFIIIFGILAAIQPANIRA
jgi:hypothetical protein